MAGSSLGPSIPQFTTQVGIHTIAIVLSIEFVVFYIVREQIVQGEAVMAGYEVDALLRLTLRAPVDVRASEQPIRNTRDRVIVRFHETAHIVAESAVPFFPEIADE
jgi:hypothetical protein